MVYVGDFKMSGPSGHMAQTWRELSSRIDMDTLGPVAKCLGCHHHVRSGVVNGKPRQIIEYGLGDFMLSCAEAYTKAAGEHDSIRRPVDTPSLEIDEEAEPSGKLQPIASSVLMKLLYGARIARQDLLSGIQMLFTRVTK